MFCKEAESAYRELMAGIEVKTLVHGEKTLMAKYRLKKGSQLPEHSHPHEQTGFLVSGQIRLHAGEDVLDAGPGDSWCIAGNSSPGRCDRGRGGSGGVFACQGRFFD